MKRAALVKAKSGYKAVYGGTIDDSLISNAVNDFLYHLEKYEFEEEKDMHLRLSINEIDDTDAISNYLANIKDEVFDGQTTAYGKIFSMKKRYYDPFVSSAELKTDSVNENSKALEEIEPIAEEITPTNTIIKSEKSSTEEKVEQIPATENILNNKENSKMENQNVGGIPNPIEDLKKQAGILSTSTSIGVTMDSSVTTNVTKDDREAALKLVKKSEEERKNYSINARVTTIAITKMDRVKKAKDGLNAMGRIADIGKTISTFIVKTGRQVDANSGEIKYTKLHESCQATDAEAVYNKLIAARDSEAANVFKPYFGKTPGEAVTSIKGVKIKTPEGNEVLIPTKDIPTFIMSKAFLYLNVDADLGQFHLEVASSKKKKSKKSYIVRIVNKNKLLENDAICAEAKVITTKLAQNKTGFKSEDFVAVKSSVASTTTSEPKKVIWRIPLEVEQFEVETVEEYSTIFQKGVGNDVKPISVEDKDQLDALQTRLTNMLAFEIKSNGFTDNAIVSEFNSNVEEIQKEKNKAITDELNAGGLESETDFE